MNILTFLNYVKIPFQYDFWHIKTTRKLTADNRQQQISAVKSLIMWYWSFTSIEVMKSKVCRIKILFPHKYRVLNKIDIRETF